MVFNAEVFELPAKVNFLEIESKLRDYKIFTDVISFQYMEPLELESFFSDLNPKDHYVTRNFIEGKCFYGIFNEDSSVTVTFADQTF